MKKTVIIEGEDKEKVLYLVEKVTNGKATKEDCIVLSVYFKTLSDLF